jgi:hypothetical protein
MIPPPSTIQDIHRVLSLIGGCLVAIGLLFTYHLMYASFWFFSGSHPSGDAPNIFEILQSQQTVTPLIETLFAGFLVGAVITHILTKRFLQSFFQNPSTHKVIPWKGFLLGLQCGLGSCVTISTVGSIAALVYESFEHSISIELLLLGPLMFSIMALGYVGIPVGILSGVVGGATELILRRMYCLSAKA